MAPNLVGDGKLSKTKIDHPDSARVTGQQSRKGIDSSDNLNRTMENGASTAQGTINRENPSMHNTLAGGLDNNTISLHGGKETIENNQIHNHIIQEEDQEYDGGLNYIRQKVGEDGSKLTLSKHNSSSRQKDMSQGSHEHDQLHIENRPASETQKGESRSNMTSAGGTINNNARMKVNINN